MTGVKLSTVSWPSDTPLTTAVSPDQGLRKPTPSGVSTTMKLCTDTSPRSNLSLAGSNPTMSGPDVVTWWIVPDVAPPAAATALVPRSEVVRVTTPVPLTVIATGTRALVGFTEIR